MTPRPLAWLMLLAAGCANSPPGAPEVRIEPTAPGTLDALVAVVTGGAKDADGDEVSYTFAWFKDGEAFPDIGSSDTVPPELTAKGEVWRVEVTAADAEDVGGTGEAFVTVLNTAPTVSGALGAAEVGTDEALVVVAEGADVDGDEVSLRFAWTVDGEPAGVEGPEVDSRLTEAGQTWVVTVLPSDGEVDGEPLVLSATITNTAPSADELSLGPDPAYVTDTLVATVALADPDGDTVAASFEWFVDGTSVQAGADDTLAPGPFAKGQVVEVEVTPEDGQAAGAPLRSGPLLIQNTPPVLAAAELSPASPREADVVSCTPVGGEDADGDLVGVTWAWTVDGVAAGSEPTLDGASFAKGQVLVCTLTPNDGEEDGPSVTSAAVTVGNTAPVVSSATLSSTGPATDDTLSVAVLSTDADGDAVELGYVWYVDGALAGTAATLAGSAFSRGQVIFVEVTPTDGTDTGATVRSDVATVVDTPPTVTAVTLSPELAYTNDVLRASVTTADVDGDAVDVAYTWFVDGAAVGGPGAELDGATWFGKGDEVYVVATPDDGTAEGSPVASAPVVIANTPPTPPTITLGPVGAVEGEDDLVCWVLGAGSDVDGDPIRHTFEWTVDGLDHSTSTTTWEAGDTVRGALTGAHELWTCTAATDDGEERSTTVTEAVRVRGAWSTRFDGSDDYVHIGDDPRLDAPTALTFEAWVKLANTSHDAPILAKEASSNRQEYWFGVYNGRFGMILSAPSAGWSCWLRDAGPVSAGVWTHIASVWDGSTFQHYQDGVLVDEGDCVTTLSSGSQPLTMGINSGYDSTRLNGHVADVRFWDHARTADEIAADMYGPLDDAGLIGWWPLDEGTGQTAEDLSGNGLDGRFGSSASTDSRDPAWSTDIPRP